MTDDELDALIRAYYGEVEGPSPEAEARMDRAFAEMIAAASTATGRPPPRRRWRLTVAFGVVLVVAALVGIMRPWGANNAAAALGELATTVALVDPLGVPEGAFSYSVVFGEGVAATPHPDRDEPLMYRYTYRFEQWWGGGVGQVRETIDALEFFTSEDAELAAATPGLVHHVVGSVETSTFEDDGGVVAEDWPTEPGRLRDAIIEHLPLDRWIPRQQEIALYTLIFLEDARTPPDLRAAALQVLAGVDGLELESSADRAVSVSFITEMDDSFGPVRRTVVIDDRGYLVEYEERTLEDSTITAGTIVTRRLITPPVEVTGLDTPTGPPPWPAGTVSG